MVSLQRKRVMMCGVPISFELVLRIVLLGLTLGLLTAAAIPKIRSILLQSNVVSVSITDSDTIPVPGALVCGGLIDSAEIEMVTRGGINPDGTKETDKVYPVPTDMYRTVNASALGLQANGDWPTDGKCVILEPKGRLAFGKNPNGTRPNALDTVIFVVHSSEDFNTTNDLGLSISIWDGAVIMAEQQPIWTGIPSINTLTFVYSEHKPLTSDKLQTRYTIQKQNLRQMQPMFYKNRTIIGRVVLSPDTFFVTRYIDKPSYSWVDLAGAIGGMASIAIAIWIFLFGSGKYKSWGVMQRYVLQTSPNAKRYREDKDSPKTYFESVKQFFRNLLIRMDSSADQELDHMPLKSTAQDRRRSTHYTTTINADAAIRNGGQSRAHFQSGAHGGAAAAAAAGAGGGGGHHQDYVHNRDMARYSMEGFNDFYFTDQGTPQTRSLRPLAPINEDDDPDNEVGELIQLIDLRIDERMWSLEKTLARYYLDGFRLRNYSRHPHSDEDQQQQQEHLEQQYQLAMDEESRTMSSPHAPSRFESDSSQMELLRENRSHPPFTSTSSPPPPLITYPPRPKVAQNYQYLDVRGGPSNSSNNGNRITAAITSGSGSTVPTTMPPGKEDITEDRGAAVGGMPRHFQPLPQFQSEIPPTHGDFLEPGFPVRRNMRGTIRRAVERLQNEWPQSQEQPSPPLPPLPQPYVPKTRYQKENTTPLNSSSDGGGGSGSGSNLPPRY
ncbi:hypothetical protein BGZ65_003473 [Modicella reniformis]|uniref:Uncharacterized protein n=1 Tax=Modicella reniformis TaxID=1440133 RepID=A0A9P6MBK9_9FUNG|nr:hypothetical protein BGZ65_003473 [Modicella reniformis]